jgi:ABC-type antimicrobial peptide transport system permease subunit
MALGAEQNRVLALIMSEALRMCTAGIAIGIVVSVLFARFAKTMLVGVSAIDPLTLVVACVALVVVGALAAAVPARRAMRVSPSEALRA